MAQRHFVGYKYQAQAHVLKNSGCDNDLAKWGLQQKVVSNFKNIDPSLVAFLCTYSPCKTLRNLA